jgi:ribosomal protein S27E
MKEIQDKAVAAETEEEVKEIKGEKEEKSKGYLRCPICANIQKETFSKSKDYAICDRCGNEFDIVWK